VNYSATSCGVWRSAPEYALARVVVFAIAITLLDSEQLANCGPYVFGEQGWEDEEDYEMKSRPARR
jgi:hypothetical protein